MQQFQHNNQNKQGMIKSREKNYASNDSLMDRMINELLFEALNSEVSGKFVI